MFIFTKSKTESPPQPDPLAVVVDALLTACANGSDPAEEVEKCLNREGVAFEKIVLPSVDTLTNAKSTFPVLKTAIGRAFSKLSKQGFFAAENFGHCADCAARDVFRTAREKHLRKCVLYTTFETAQMQAIGVCTIRYGLSYCCKTKGAQIARTRELGREVAQALTDAGLVVEWNDDPETAIKARLKED